MNLITLGNMATRVWLKITKLMYAICGFLPLSPPNSREIYEQPNPSGPKHPYNSLKPIFFLSWWKMGSREQLPPKSKPGKCLAKRCFMISNASDSIKWGGRGRWRQNLALWDQACKDERFTNWNTHAVKWILFLPAAVLISLLPFQLYFPPPPHTCLGNF